MHSFQKNISGITIAFHRFFLFFTVFFLLHCSAPTQQTRLVRDSRGNISVISASTASATKLYQEKPISLIDPSLTTCAFRPETRIAHFPMYHFPPSGRFSDSLEEKIIKSQFQLLHTILMYRHHQIAVFDENVTVNDFSPKVFNNLENKGGRDVNYTRADGTIFNLQERFDTARSLFHAGIPQYYEQLAPRQMEYLFNIGAAITLYFLGYIPQLHKVIAHEDLQIVMDDIDRRGGVGNVFRVSSSEQDYYIYTFREEKLFFQVTQFFNINPSFSGLALISYGASHKLQDEFNGYPFEEGRSCLDWDRPSSIQQPLLSAFPPPYLIPHNNHPEKDEGIP